MAEAETGSARRNLRETGRRLSRLIAVLARRNARNAEEERTGAGMEDALEQRPGVSPDMAEQIRLETRKQEDPEERMQSVRPAPRPEAKPSRRQAVEDRVLSADMGAALKPHPELRAQKPKPPNETLEQTRWLSEVQNDPMKLADCPARFIDQRMASILWNGCRLDQFKSVLSALPPPQFHRFAVMLADEVYGRRRAELAEAGRADSSLRTDAGRRISAMQDECQRRIDAGEAPTPGYPPGLKPGMVPKFAIDLTSPRPPWANYLPWAQRPWEETVLTTPMSPKDVSLQNLAMEQAAADARRKEAEVLAEKRRREEEMLAENRRREEEWARRKNAMMQPKPYGDPPSG